MHVDMLFAVPVLIKAEAVAELRQKVHCYHVRMQVTAVPQTVTSGDPGMANSQCRVLAEHDSGMGHQ